MANVEIQVQELLPVDLNRSDRADRACELLDEGGNRRSGVGDQAMVRLVDLADLRGVDVDVDEGLAFEQVGVKVEGIVLRERVPDGQDDVGALEGLEGAAVAA